jgi:hypothetical protein
LRYVLLAAAGDRGCDLDGGHWVALCEVERKLMISVNHVQIAKYVV